MGVESEEDDDEYTIHLQVEKSHLKNQGGYRDGSKHGKVRKRGSLHSTHT
jgi:hypothetical protein